MTTAEKAELNDLILGIGWIDGAHHKQYLIDQILRRLMGADYDAWVVGAEWDQGVPP